MISNVFLYHILPQIKLSILGRLVSLNKTLYRHTTTTIFWQHRTEKTILLRHDQGVIEAIDFRYQEIDSRDRKYNITKSMHDIIRVYKDNSAFVQPSKLRSFIRYSLLYQQFDKTMLSIYLSNLMQSSPADDSIINFLRVRYDTTIRKVYVTSTSLIVLTTNNILHWFLPIDEKYTPKKEEVPPIKESLVSIKAPNIDSVNKWTGKRLQQHLDNKFREKNNVQSSPLLTSFNIVITAKKKNFDQVVIFPNIAKFASDIYKDERLYALGVDGSIHKLWRGMNRRVIASGINKVVEISVIRGITPGMTAPSDVVLLITSDGRVFLTNESLKTFYELKVKVPILKGTVGIYSYKNMPNKIVLQLLGIDGGLIYGTVETIDSDLIVHDIKYLPFSQLMKFGQ